MRVFTIRRTWYGKLVLQLLDQEDRPVDVPASYLLRFPGRFQIIEHQKLAGLEARVAQAEKRAAQQRTSRAKKSDAEASRFG